MLWYHYVLGGVLILLSIALVAIVLMQEGRSQGVSGVIMGGSDSYLNKTKGRSNQARLERLTKYLAIVFFVIVLAAFLILLFI